MIVSLAEYLPLTETDYLYRNPANVRRLLESVRELETSGGHVHELIKVE